MSTATVTCAHRGGISLPAIQHGDKVYGPLTLNFGDNEVDGDTIETLIAEHPPTALQFQPGGYLSKTATKTLTKVVEQEPEESADKASLLKKKK